VRRALEADGHADLAGAGAAREQQVAREVEADLAHAAHRADARAEQAKQDRVDRKRCEQFAKRDQEGDGQTNLGF
jgi:hypothetical protein